jgi:hypothetical protein
LPELQNSVGPCRIAPNRKNPQRKLTPIRATDRSCILGILAENSLCNGLCIYSGWDRDRGAVGQPLTEKAIHNNYGHNTNDDPCSKEDGQGFFLKFMLVIFLNLKGPMNSLAQSLHSNRFIPIVAKILIMPLYNIKLRADSHPYRSRQMEFIVGSVFDVAAKLSQSRMDKGVINHCIEIFLQR